MQDKVMTRRYLLAAASLLLAPALVFASGMSQFCKFSTAENKSIIGQKYRIDEAYKAADLVVVGMATENRQNGRTQTFEVAQGYAKIGAEKILVEALKSFFESRPDPISYE